MNPAPKKSILEQIPPAPPHLVLGRRVTLQQWMAGRRRRREISDLISKEECGKDTSDDDAHLRAKYNGRRNLPFTPTEHIAGMTLEDCRKLSQEAASQEGDA